MTPSMRHYSIGISSAFLAGLGTGWALFRLPGWACGPFRAEKAAEWSGVLVASMAAVATFAAVIVALRTAEDARETALLLQQNEVERQIAKDNATRSRLAVVFTRELYILYGELQSFRMQLELETTPEGINTCLAELMPDDHLSLLERFAPDLHVFPVEASTALLNVVGSWITYSQGPAAPEFTSEEIALRAADVTIRTTANLMEDVERAHAAMLPLFPDGIQATPLGEF